MRVIVFAKNIQESLINRWPGVVKFCDIGVFKPINEHLATKYQQKRAHNLARPFGEYCEALRQDSPSASSTSTTIDTGKRPYAHLNEVS